MTYLILIFIQMGALVRGNLCLRHIDEIFAPTVILSFDCKPVSPKNAGKTDLARLPSTLFRGGVKAPQFLGERGNNLALTIHREPTIQRALSGRHICNLPGTARETS